MNKNILTAGIVFLIIGFGVGYWYGGSIAYDNGYKTAASDIKAQQEESAKKRQKKRPKRPTRSRSAILWKE